MKLYTFRTYVESQGNKFWLFQNMILILPPPQIILKVVESDLLVIAIQTCPALNMKRRVMVFFPQGGYEHLH